VLTSGHARHAERFDEVFAEMCEEEGEVMWASSQLGNHRQLLATVLHVIDGADGMHLFFFWRVNFDFFF
jgi:hypothetical protein